MTVDEIRKLSPEQMHRMAEIRSEIEALESELDQIIKGEKPRRSPKSKAKSKAARKKEADAASTPAAGSSQPVEIPPVTQEQEPAVPLGGVLSRLTLPQKGSSTGAGLES